MIVAPKAIVNNLKDNIWEGLKYSDRFSYVSLEYLSRSNSIIDELDKNDECPSDYDVLLFDEMHRLFGECTYNQLKSDMRSFEHAKIIAMTATPEDSIRHFNKLSTFVGSDNIITYDMAKAIKDGVAKTLNYFPCVLSYNTECNEYIEELMTLPNRSAYVTDCINKLYYEVSKLNRDTSEIVYEYVSSKINKLDCSNGARVFVFFNTVSTLRNNKSLIVQTVKSLYTKYGNKNFNVHYYEYTSHNDCSEAFNVIKNNPRKNTVDIIATVNKGTEGIHPKNVQFGMIMCGTKSIRRYIQMMGRVTNLADDEYDTNVFDFRDNLSFLGNLTISTGKYQLHNRHAYRREKALKYFSGDEISELNLGTPTLIDKCTSMENTLDLLERINMLNILLDEDHSVLLNMIKNNLNIIDTEYSGNIVRFLKKNYNKTIVKEYEEIRKALLYDSYTDDDKKQFTDFAFLGYRLFISPDSGKRKSEETYKLYNMIKKQLKRGKVSSQFLNLYAMKYMNDEFDSSQCALIQQHDIIVDALTKHLPKLKPSDFDCNNTWVINKCKYVLALFNELNGLLDCDNMDDSYIDEVNIKLKKANTTLFYLENSKSKELSSSKKYIYAVRKYVDTYYKDLYEIENCEYTFHSRLIKIVDILDAYVDNKLKELPINLVTIINNMANSFSELCLTHKMLLSMHNINSLNAFYNKIVDNTITKELLDKAIHGDTCAFDELKHKIGADQIPKRYLKEFNKLKEDSITKRDVIIAVQHLSVDDNKHDFTVINKALKTGIVKSNEVISMAFSSYPFDLRDRVSMFIEQGLDLKDSNFNYIINYSNKNNITKTILNKCENIRSFNAYNKRQIATLINGIYD